MNNIARDRLKALGLLVGIEDRPTLRMTEKDQLEALRQIHEGAWTLGLDEDDLPGFDHVRNY